MGSISSDKKCLHDYQHSIYRKDTEDLETLHKEA